MPRVDCLGRTWPVEWWRPGVRLKSPALDWETELIREPETPRGAILCAADTARAVVVHPTMLVPFLREHRTEPWIFHHAAFDIHVTRRMLQGTPLARLPLEKVHQWQVRDTMLLGQLLQIATGEFRVPPGEEEAAVVADNLGTLAKRYLGEEVSKSDPYRLRFGELIGLTEAEVAAHPEWESGFLPYAVKDVIVTAHLHPEMERRAKVLTAYHRVKRSPYGPLTEYLQIAASVALYAMSRKPIRVDQEARVKLECRYREMADAAVQTIERYDYDLFSRYTERCRVAKSGYRLAAKTGLPKLAEKRLRDHLEREADRLGVSPPRSTGKRRLVSLAADDWRPYQDRIPLVKAVIDLGFAADRLKFLAGLRAEAIYTNYNPLVVTGRTSARTHKTLPGVNFQQMPGEPEFRDLFVADPGTVWQVSDYSYLELRALGAVCRDRYGRSRLADAVASHTRAVREGRAALDPHEVMAAMILGVSQDDYTKIDAGVRKKARGRAKVANFGFPGGLGVVKFIAWAKAEYDITFTQAEVKALKRTWIDAYPEMARYMAEDTAEVLAYNLGVKGDDVRRAFGPRLLDLANCIRGFCHHEALWNKLVFFAKEKSPRWSEVLGPAFAEADRAYLSGEAPTPGGGKLTRLLLTVPCCTLTGRVRGRCSYTEARNTPFQGVAGDGGKLALWRLYYEGFDVRAFVHDEFIVAYRNPAPAVLKRARDIMEKSMEEVIGQGVPVLVEPGELTTKWTK